LGGYLPASFEGVYSPDRHVHALSYAALVLEGSYEEAGDLGRFPAQAGDVLLHDRFEAHLKSLSRVWAVILNLFLPANCVFHPGLGSLADPDSMSQDLLAKGDRLKMLVTE
jgi:hypothetical protein